MVNIKQPPRAIGELYLIGQFYNGAWRRVIIQPYIVVNRLVLPDSHNRQQQYYQKWPPGEQGEALTLHVFSIDYSVAAA